MPIGGVQPRTQDVLSPGGEPLAGDLILIIVIYAHGHYTAFVDPSQPPPDAAAGGGRVEVHNISLVASVRIPTSSGEQFPGNDWGDGSYIDIYSKYCEPFEAAILAAHEVDGNGDPVSPWPITGGKFDQIAALSQQSFYDGGRVHLGPIEPYSESGLIPTECYGWVRHEVGATVPYGQPFAGDEDGNAWTVQPQGGAAPEEILLFDSNHDYSATGQHGGAYAVAVLEGVVRGPGRGHSIKVNWDRIEELKTVPIAIPAYYDPPTGRAGTGKPPPCPLRGSTAATIPPTQIDPTGVETFGTLLPVVVSGAGATVEKVYVGMWLPTDHKQSGWLVYVDLLPPGFSPVDANSSDWLNATVILNGEYIDDGLGAGTDAADLAFFGDDYEEFFQAPVPSVGPYCGNWKPDGLSDGFFPKRGFDRCVGGPANGTWTFRIRNYNEVAVTFNFLGLYICAPGGNVIPGPVRRGVRRRRRVVGRVVIPPS